MVKSARVNLTVQRIVEATCPPGKSEAILQDAVVPGLGVRVYPTGRKSLLHTVSGYSIGQMAGDDRRGSGGSLSAR
jgi:hypothetical protein